MSRRSRPAGGLLVLEAIEHAKKDGWVGGYRAALADLQNLWESRGGPEADVRELLTDMRGDAEDIEGREYPAGEASREKLAGDRLKTVAAMLRQGKTVREIGKGLAISKSHAGRLIDEVRAAGLVPFLSHPGQKRDNPEGDADV